MLASDDPPNITCTHVDGRWNGPTTHTMPATRPDITHTQQVVFPRGSRGAGPAAFKGAGRSTKAAAAAAVGVAFGVGAPLAGLIIAALGVAGGGAAMPRV